MTMSDGERKYLQDLLSMSQQGLVRVKEGSDKMWILSGMIAVLGFVLDDPQLRHYLPSVLEELKGFGVNPVADPNLN